ncbi:MAG TPA: multicopper oxidase domain-containing protein, partial [Gemmatimonadales bacterium]
VRSNDNRQPAGTLALGVLTLRLEARLGTWHPDGDDAPGAAVPAFAEWGRAPEIPGPLIRVPAGTDVAITLRNALAATLIVHGLSPRPLADSVADTLQLAAGATRTVRFRLAVPGTYYYWGTSTARPSLGRRFHEDAQLSGAIVVDEPGRAAPADRVIVIGMWADTAGAPSPRQELFVLNGRSWPRTERLAYTQGDTVRWRVLNVTADFHPMHLHGFYFRVDSRGDVRADTTYEPMRGEMEVTERMIPGETVRLTWVPDRAGNWLFHCHVPGHIGPRDALGMKPAPGRGRHALKHGPDEMTGLILGISIRPRAGDVGARPIGNAPRRHLRLLARQNAGGTVANPYYGFALANGDAEPPPDSGEHAGPTIVLTRGEPVTITVVNRTPEPTSVHWHGIELESYFDGVGGWSGDRALLAPVIAPGDSFDARFAPPRAGTFIYHTHFDEIRQEPAGLAGALVVLEPGAPWDLSRDLVVLISTPSDSALGLRAVLINGDSAPPPADLRAGTTYRLRFINIAVNRGAMRVQVVRDTSVVQWRVVAKDGAAWPAARQGMSPARRPLSVGETVDVELTPDAPGDLRVEARSVGGALLGVLPIHVQE